MPLAKQAHQRVHRGPAHAGQQLAGGTAQGRRGQALDQAAGHGWGAPTHQCLHADLANAFLGVLQRVDEGLEDAFVVDGRQRSQGLLSHPGVGVGHGLGERRDGLVAAELAEGGGTGATYRGQRVDQRPDDALHRLGGAGARREGDREHAVVVVR